MKIQSPDDEDRSSAILPILALFGLLALEFAVTGAIVIVAAVCKALALP